MPDNPITISANSDIVYKSGVWTFQKANFTVNGLTLPSFTAEWIAINLAGGLLSGVGGLIFQVIATKFGGGGPNMENLLTAQLREFEKVIAQQSVIDEIRRASAAFDSAGRLMRQYMNEKDKRFRIEQALEKSSDSVSILKTLGHDGYLLFLNLATLHLAILSELTLENPNERLNYQSAVEEFSAHHDQLRSQAAQELTEFGQLWLWLVRKGKASPPFPDPKTFLISVQDSRAAVPENSVYGRALIGLPHHSINSKRAKELRAEIAAQLEKDPNFIKNTILNAKESNPPIIVHVPGENFVPNPPQKPVDIKAAAKLAALEVWEQYESADRVVTLDWDMIRSDVDTVFIKGGGTVARWKESLPLHS